MSPPNMHWDSAYREQREVEGPRWNIGEPQPATVSSISLAVR